MGIEVCYKGEVGERLIGLKIGDVSWGNVVGMGRK